MTAGIVVDLTDGQSEKNSGLDGRHGGGARRLPHGEGEFFIPPFWIASVRLFFFVLLIVCVTARFLFLFFSPFFPGPSCVRCPPHHGRVARIRAD